MLPEFFVSFSSGTFLFYYFLHFSSTLGFLTSCCMFLHFTTHVLIFFTNFLPVSLSSIIFQSFCNLALSISLYFVFSFLLLNSIGLLVPILVFLNRYYRLYLYSYNIMIGVCIQSPIASYICYDSLLYIC